MDKICFNFIDVEIPGFKPEFFVLWIEDIIKSNNKVLGEVSYIFSNDEYLLELNQKYLSHDYFTDIITFNYNEENSLSGDIFVSYTRVFENAKEYGSAKVFDELCRVMAHGVLHLVGFNDKTNEEKKMMRLKEDECLNRRKRFT